MDARNLLQPPDPVSAGEAFETLLERPGVRLERIISTGQSTPPGRWYDQPGDEWVLLLQGEAALEFDDGSRVELGRGDAVLLPARLRHRVARTSADPPCIWLALHLGTPGSGPAAGRPAPAD